MERKRKLIVICLIILLSSVLSGFITEYFFIADTPLITAPVAQLLHVQYVYTDGKTLDLKKDTSPLQKIGVGVYAQNSQDTSYRVLYFNEMSWKEYTFHVKQKDGSIKDIVLKIPIDQPIPSSDTVEKLYR